jgi:type IV secretion system protein TrbJ
MKCKRVVVILSLGLMVAWPRPAGAIFGVGDVVFDPSMYAQQFLQLAQAIQETQSAAAMLKSMTTGGMAGTFSSPLGLINNLGDVINTSEGLAYNADNVASQFRALYPATQTGGTVELPITQIQQTMNTFEGVLASARQMSASFQQADSVLSNLEAMNDGAGGTLQGQQVANEIALAQDRQLQLNAQIQLAQNNLQAVNDAEQLQAETAAQNQATVIGNEDVPDWFPNTTAPANALPGMP